MTPLEIRQFFEEYGASFTQSEVEVAHFYNVPCITARMGAVRLNATRQDIEAFFADVLHKYREQGFTHGDFVTLSTAALGANAALVTNRWAYRNAQGAILWEWTFTYNLYKGPSGWKILLQTMHDAT